MSLHVVNILFKPAEDIMDILNTIEGDAPPPEPTRKRKVRANKGKDDHDGVKTALLQPTTSANVLHSAL